MLLLCSANCFAEFDSSCSCGEILCWLPYRVVYHARDVRLRRQGMTATLMNKPVMTVLAVALAAWHSMGVAAQADRITSFTLSSGGLAQIERQIHVSGQDSIKLPVPLEQVDDVLKSLVVRDPGGQATRIVLDGESPVKEAF